MKNVVCFDLEGPLSPQDNAYEVMGLIGDGRRLFEAISRYDDMLALEGRGGYEPGDTLSLITPFLLLHRITEGDIAAVSKKANLVDGARELLDDIKEKWNVYVISTSYRQHALNICRQLDIPKENVYSTELPLERFHGEIDEKDLGLVADVEREMLAELQRNAGDERIKKMLDGFYSRAANTSLAVLGEVKVVGGMRKLHALQKVVEREGKSMNDVVAVGDSITDSKMLDAVKKGGGTAVVFNGNKYALPYGNIGLACSSMRPLQIILDAFTSGGTKKALDAAAKWGENGARFLENPRQVPDDYMPDAVRRLLTQKSPARSFLKPDLRTLDGMTEEEKQKVVEIHSTARKHVRGAAGSLG